jgi:ArsR family transcriptional regulator
MPFREYAYQGIDMSKPADLVAIYQCLCDRTRLRILNLLREGPLCVCHVQDVLGEPQVKVSKHLAYLKAHGVVTVRREGYWRIYALAPKPHRALEMNLACLQDAAGEDRVFQRDSEKLETLRGCLSGDAPACCAKPQPIKLKVG